MSIAVITPTLNRPDLLDNLKRSLRLYAPNLIHLVSVETGPRSAPEVVNGLLRQAFSLPDVEAVVYLADYCEVQEHFGARMAEAFAKGNDHLQGVRIANMYYVEDLREFCFWGIGRAFYERFPDGQVFCPDYWHFYVDTELGLAAKKLGRFKMDHSIKIFTHHPNSENAQWDETHAASRAYRKHDAKTHEERRARDILWGVEFDRVHDALPWETPTPAEDAITDTDPAPAAEEVEPEPETPAKPAKKHKKESTHG